MMCGCQMQWVAGIFEGEGSAYIRTAPSGKRSACMAVAMTDEDVVRRFGELVGIGSVTGPYQDKRHSHWKVQWKWQVQTSKDSLPLLKLLLPYMGTRRTEKFNELIEEFDDE